MYGFHNTRDTSLVRAAKQIRVAIFFSCTREFVRLHERICRVARAPLMNSSRMSRPQVNRPQMSRPSDESSPDEPSLNRTDLNLH